MYAKNVTDNLPEVKIYDTEGTGPGPINWAGPYATVSPPGRLVTMPVNGYREGICLGFRAYSHYMSAHWATDAGQRIGPAYEIEGTRLPNAPTNLTVR